jgi:hypothetical protein
VAEQDDRTLSAIALAVSQVAVIAVAVSIGGEVVLDDDHRVVVLKDQVSDVLPVSAVRGVDLLEYQVRCGREWLASHEASVHLVDEDAQEPVFEVVISLGFQ